MTHRILILGGTTEARQLAGKLAARADISVMLSLAGRTENPAAQGVPVRVGGFGGAGGLAFYLHQNKIDLLIDATHPYAAQISANAADAAGMTGVPIVALRRPEWEAVEGDRWMLVDTVASAVTALGSVPRRVFLALGRQEVAAFEAAPRHHYLIRSVDPVEPRLAVPDAAYLLARGPFHEVDERALLQEHRIDVVVSKNSGGEATYGKIAAARALGVEVVMIRRPALPDVTSAETIESLAAMVDHFLVGHVLRPAAERGV
ncbi:MULTISPECIES: cobalt-precorrin-6A reductase [unclassified Mesorhizobium]|uniref:cobalt-precorrin-6A reductase n=1 Tax=unclassified Mesorhizobium TaxID=325217 RepID=UPI00333C19BB